MYIRLLLIFSSRRGCDESETLGLTLNSPFLVSGVLASKQPSTGSFDNWER